MLTQVIGLGIVLPYPNIALSPPYPAAAKPRLAVPTPGVSAATTPVLDTRFVMLNRGVVLPTLPYPNIALSPPYPAAAKLFLAVPTPGVSAATTPVLDTRLVIDVASEGVEGVLP